MSDILISIITTCYNKSEFLEEAINSVLRQSHYNFEWIIINDGSTDNSSKIILSQSDNRIKYYEIENCGQAVSSNYGLTLAKGNYIKFFDADDVLNEDHLKEQLRIADSRQDILVSCLWARFYNNNILTARFTRETVWQNLESFEWIKKALRQESDMMPAWLWLIPANLLKNVGGWNTNDSMNNDFEFSIRLLLNVREVKFADKAILYYRSGNNTMSTSKSKVDFQKAVFSNELGCNHLINYNNTPEIKKLCADRFQGWVYRIYPIDKKLVEYLEEKIKTLGGSTRQMKGSDLFNIFRFILGWKIAKQLQLKKTRVDNFLKKVFC